MCQTIKWKFQNNSTALSKWADKWGIDFNVKKSKILLFNSKSELSHYSLHGHKLEIVEDPKILYVSWGHHSVRYEVHCSYSRKAHDCKPATRYNQKSTVLGSYQCQTICLQDSLPPSSRVCISCLGSKQQGKCIKHRTSRSSSTIYSW